VIPCREKWKTRRRLASAKWGGERVEALIWGCFASGATGQGLDEWISWRVWRFAFGFVSYLKRGSCSQRRSNRQRGLGRWAGNGFDVTPPRRQCASAMMPLYGTHFRLRRESMLSLQSIMTRVASGSSKSANAKLHTWMQANGKVDGVHGKKIMPTKRTKLKPDQFSAPLYRLQPPRREITHATLTLPVTHWSTQG